MDGLLDHGMKKRDFAARFEEAIGTATRRAQKNWLHIPTAVIPKSRYRSGKSGQHSTGVHVHNFQLLVPTEKYLSAKDACSHEEVDYYLLQIMTGIHAAGQERARCPEGALSYVYGTNIAGFVKVSDVMLAQG